MERVSVVIPCYNEEKFIEQTLGCFEKQTFKDFEIVIINAIDILILSIKYKISVE